MSAFCPQCGASITANDRFCSSCGHALATSAGGGAQHVHVHTPGASRPRRKSRIGWIIVLLAVLAAGGYAYANPGVIDQVETQVRSLIAQLTQGSGDNTRDKANPQQTPPAQPGGGDRRY
jgi:uncharacterized membrane protein YvbJ